MAKKTMINDLTVGKVPKQLISFALPFMMANVIQTLYGVVDMAVVGQNVGHVGMSAINIGSLATQLFTNFCMGLASGGQIVLAQLVGSKNNDKINNTIGSFLSLIVLFGLGFAILGVVGADTILGLVNTPAEAFPQTKKYLVICSIGMVFIFGYNAMSAVLRGMGDSRRPLLFVAVSGVINIVLDLLFVKVFGMDAEGAAIATVISQAFSLLFSLVYLFRRRESFGFDFKLSSFKIEKDSALPVLKLGLPQGIQQAAVIVSFMFVNAQINLYGTLASAVTGAGLKINTIQNVVNGGITMAEGNMIGQNHAAKKIDRIQKTLFTSLAICLAFTTIFSLFFYFYPEAVFGIFNKEPEVLEMAREYRPFGIVAFYAFALMMPFTALVNGVGNSILAFFIGIMDGIVARIGLSILFGSIMGLHGYWLGIGSAGYVSFILAFIYYLSGKWKTRKPVIRE